MNLMFHDAHPALEGVVELCVAHQHRRFILEHPVANRGRNAEAFALMGLGGEPLAFEQQQHAALRVDGLNRQMRISEAGTNAGMQAMAKPSVKIGLNAWIDNPCRVGARLGRTRLPLVVYLFQKCQ